MRKLLLLFLILISGMSFAQTGAIPAAGDIIFNEYASDNNASGNDYFELLVLAPSLDLRGLRVSDNELVSGAFNTGESVFVFGTESYLADVKKGTLIVVWTVTTGVTADTDPSDFSMTLTPATGVTISADGIGGTTNAGLSTGGEALYLYLPGPDLSSAGTDNIYLDFISFESDGGDAPSGLTDINFPSVGDNGYFIGTTASGADVTTNWVIYDFTTGSSSTSATPGLPNPSQDLSSLRIPLVNLSVSANAGTEAGTTAITVTATASSAVSGDQTVNIAVSGTGITSSDYTLSSTTITILSGATTGTVTFTVADDTNVEATETATLTISSPSSGIALGSATTQDITITDNDVAPNPTVNLSVSANAGTEAAATVITVTATASSAVSGDQTVSIAVSGTGITSTDYTLSATTITILNGATTGTATFTVVNDTDEESTETATLTISSPTSGIALGSTTTQNITITDNDAASNPTVNLSVSASAGTEAAATTITVTATASSAVSGNQTVNIAVSGTGITSADYTLSATTITILNGATTGTATFTVANDTDVETTETATLTISSPTSGIALGSTTTQNITITDNDAAPNPTVNLSVSANAGTEAAATTITVTATASSAVSGNQTVNIAVSGTGITSADYTLSATTITILNGATTGTATFTVANDTDVETTETATLTISSPTSGIALGATTTQDITITDNDVAPIPTVNLSVSANAGTEAAATAITVTATASSAVSGNQTVNIAVSGTGITSADYTLSATTINILNGATAGTATFTIVDDSNFESLETAVLTISNPSAGLTLGSTTTQSITITDNDAPRVTLSLSASTVSETTPASTITVTATASSAVTGNQTIGVAVTGTGITSGDFTLSAATITILSGQTSGTATLTILDDATVESAETATVTLSNPSSGIALGSTINQNITISDNDATVSFATERTISNEDAGSVSIPVNISVLSNVGAVSTQVTIVDGNAVAGVDYTFTNQTVTFAANTTTAQNVAITILDNTDPNRDKYLVLQLGTVTNGTLGSIRLHTVFIKDNDRTPINPSNALNLTYSGNYKVPESGSSAEISAYDPASKRLFVVNSLKNKMEILNLTTPSAITRISTIDITPYGAGLNSIATKNGIVAIAIENVGTANGAIAFFDINGVLLKSVEAGNLPDMITFTPDGKSVLTANEGQPIFYTPTLSDPEGSITMVDLSSVTVPADVANITQANVTQINFNAFDSQMASLKSQGVRIFGPGSTVSQDLEPEYIAVSADSKKAFVTLQENNAMAIVDLVTKQVTSVLPLGFKDHSLPENALDASDQSGDVFLVNWKVKGMYMPDAIAYFEVAGTPYVITANEGDAREYTGITDEVTVGSLNLDATAFPNAAALKLNSALGRLNVTNKLGDTDGDGDFDELYAFGARSFTIWNATNGARIFDSGAQFERITSEDPTWAPFFNANNSTGNPSRKNRSDNKGPEPEGVAVATIGNKQYAFIALERIGGVMTYDVTNPANPVFVGYDNKRSNPAAATDDLGSEGIIYISATDSPTGNPLVLLSNEVSGTVSVYSIAVNPTVSLSASANNGSEATGSVITLTATASAAVTAAQTIELEVKGAGITSADYTLSSTTITIAAGATTGTATLTLLNDTDLEGSEILSVGLKNPSADITIGSIPRQDIFIFDNDFPAAPATSTTDIKLSFVSSYLNVGANPGNSAEISAYDPASKRLYIANSLGKRLNIVDFSNPAAMTSVASIDVATYGGINSVAVRNGLVAVAIEAANLTDNGSVVFFDKDGVFLKQVTVGAMPDMITFSPNGNLVLTPNEGEPNDAYTVDPEGTVSIINISGGIATLAQTNVTTVNFNSFDSQLATLRSQGLRVYGPNNPTLSKDVEPEYITFSADGSIAYITLQEANAIAELNIATKTFTAIRPLGLKDHNLIKNGLDASDTGISFPAITNLPIKGMYQPDAIASYTVNNETYLVTANEGDSRVYPRAGSAVGAEGSIYSEEVRVGAAAYVLDPVKFPNAALLKSNAVLGRLQLTNKTGDTDGDGDFDEIHALGSRSFSIWKATATGLTQIFDSGDQFERITLADATYGSMFNASHDNNTAKNRSDNKGPEPEGVAISSINGKTYAFISLERIGGVMVYNVTDPANPVFVQWANSRSTTAVAGDRGSEGIFYISAKDSPTGVPLVVLSNEVSSTISVYSVGNGLLATAPTALTAINSNTTISTTLTWTDNSSAETAFDIQRSTSETTGFASIGSVLPNVVTYTDNTVVAGTTYFYRVRAANDFGYSNSNTVSVVTKQNQTITFTAPADKTLGDAAFALGATSSSALAITYTTTSDKITISGSQATLVKAGRVSVTAAQAGNASFLPANSVERNFCIKPAKPTVTLSNSNSETVTLTSSSATGNQWFLGANAIAGATNATLSVTAAGIYKVQVKVEDCISEFSADQTIIVTGDIGSAHHSVTAFPNPVKDILTVVFESESGKKDVSITELTGKQMLRQEVNGKEATFNVQGYSQGIYLIKVLSDKGTSVIRFEKQ